VQKRFLALDGLRGVCAVCVLFNHCVDFFHKGPLILHGFLAVDVFFIMSGFVIALTYEEKLKRRGETGAYLFSRARRLFPTYWIGATFNISIFVALISAGYIVSQDTWWMVWLLIPLTTVLMIPDYVTPDGLAYPAMNGVAWSLFTEWIAYIVYGFSMHRWRTGLLFVLAILGWGLIASVGVWSGRGWFGGFERSTLLTWGVLRCLSGFAMGVVIFRIHKHPLFERLPVISTELLLLFWLCLAGLGSGQIRPVFDPIIVMILSPALICLLIRSDFKAPRFCKELGELSYPLYVIHPGIILLATYTPVFGLDRGINPVGGLFVVGLCLFMAWIVAKVVSGQRRQIRERYYNFNVPVR
jgi:peptidoglycan/LPS O-acetylase OafA/YrhL